MTASERTGIKFERKWAMPDSETFAITPIHEFVQEEVRASDGVWIDPFAGDAEVADVTNDLNPENDTDYTLDATEFLARFDTGEVDGGVLFDPPYSPRQIKECYESVGLEVTQETTQSTFWSEVKDEIRRVTAASATVVTCSWNSNGVGGDSFEKRRILIVPHGGWHNDTIVMAEDRTQTRLGGGSRVE